LLNGRLSYVTHLVFISNPNFHRATANLCRPHNVARLQSKIKQRYFPQTRIVRQITVEKENYCVQAWSVLRSCTVPNYVKYLRLWQTVPWMCVRPTQTVGCGQGRRNQ